MTLHLGISDCFLVLMFGWNILGNNATEVRSPLPPRYIRRASCQPVLSLVMLNVIIRFKRFQQISPL